VGVIDRLETVDVHEREDESPIRSSGPVDLPLQIDRPTITPKRSGQAVKACLMPLETSLSAIVPGAPAIVRCPPSVVCGLPPVLGGLRGVAPWGATVASIAPLRRPVALVGRPIASLRRQVALVGSGVTLAVAPRGTIRHTCWSLPLVLGARPRRLRR
jgi:hypothetical protein